MIDDAKLQTLAERVTELEKTVRNYEGRFVAVKDEQNQLNARLNSLNETIERRNDGISR
jgi:DNA repair ATPase RecN